MFRQIVTEWKRFDTRLGHKTSGKFLKWVISSTSSHVPLKITKKESCVWSSQRWEKASQQTSEMMHFSKFHSFLKNEILHFPSFFLLFETLYKSKSKYCTAFEIRCEYFVVVWKFLSWPRISRQKKIWNENRLWHRFYFTAFTTLLLFVWISFFFLMGRNTICKPLNNCKATGLCLRLVSFHVYA
mgnify:CR=1 FL=1